MRSADLDDRARESCAALCRAVDNFVAAVTLQRRTSAERAFELKQAIGKHMAVIADIDAAATLELGT